MVKRLLLILVIAPACSYLPANQECAFVDQQLAGIENLKMASVECESALLAGDGVHARVEMNDGAVVKFERLGFNAFTSNAINIVVAEASGLVPRVASCAGIGPPNFHRDAPLGHHFRPTLIDTKEAVSRYRELLEEVEFWPQCPQHWEAQDRMGRRFRYCARKADATDEPSRPTNCG
jgi:hypothetical protein